jgi:uncharacterized protein (TIGR02271 family)
VNDTRSTVIDSAGREAHVESSAAGSVGRLVLRLDSGERVEVPRDLLEQRNDGTYRLPLAFSSLTAEGGAVRIPLAEEKLRVDKRVRETGRVRLTKHVDVREEVVDEPLFREKVEVERVPVDRYVDEPVPTRTEGETTIIPVMEEVLVVEKRLRLKEELHVTRRRTEHRDPQRVTLRSERVEVERTGPDTASSDAPR